MVVVPRRALFIKRLLFSVRCGRVKVRHKLNSRFGEVCIFIILVKIQTLLFHLSQNGEVCVAANGVMYFYSAWLRPRTLYFKEDKRMKHTKRLLIVLVMALLCAVLVIAVSAEGDVTIVEVGNYGEWNEDTQNCFNNITWTLDSEGTMTLSGEGRMYSCTSAFVSDNGCSASCSHGLEDSICIKIKKIIIEDGIEDIGAGAFSSCYNLDEVVIRGNISSVGICAFLGCTALKYIQLPKTLERIGAGAFWGCNSLEAINIPSGVTCIENSTFLGCNSLEQLVLPDSITSIGNLAFYGCNEITYLVIPDSLKNIGNEAFFGCNNLTDVVIGDGVETLNGFSFSGNSNLQSIIIGNSITIIDSFMFYGCCNLSNVTIGNHVTIIGDQAFCDCEKLKCITIPNSVTRICSGAFADCSSLKSLIIDTNACLDFTEFNYSDSVLEKIVFGEHVKTIYNSAFSNFRTIKTIVIKEGVESIENSAFSYCTALESVSIPSTVSSIGKSAFSGCKMLKNISTLEGLVRIEDSTFIGCSSLESFMIPANITEIGNSAFGNCSSLKNITIPIGVTRIGDWAFGGCSELTDVVLPNSLISIGSYTFYGCDGLIEFIVPDSVVDIGCDVFGWCDKLETVTVGNAVTSFSASESWIGPLDAPNLQTVVLSKQAKTVSYNFIQEITDVSQLIVDERNPYLMIENGVLFNKDQTELIFYLNSNKQTEYTVPKSVKKIKRQAFYNNRILEKLILQEGLEEIENESIQSCLKLNEIVFPLSLQRIGANSFASEIMLPCVYTAKSMNTVFEENVFGSYFRFKDSVPIEMQREIFFAAFGWIEPTKEIQEYLNNIEEYIEYSDPENKEFFYVGILRCHAGSTAEAYAIEHGMDYELVHFYDTFVETVESSCTEQGYSKYQCIYCEQTEKRDFETELGHDPQIGEAVPPTCTEDGYTPFICTRCGETVSKGDIVTAPGHSYNPIYNWAADNSTVTASLVCSRCQDVSTEETVGVICKTVEASCTSPGRLTYTSEGFACKSFTIQTKTIAINQKPHATMQIREVSPTCTKEGVGSYWRCSSCNSIFEDEAATKPLTKPPVLPKLPHTPENPVKKNETPATCTESGSYDEVVYCSDCGNELSRKTIETNPLGHVDKNNDGECDRCKTQLTDESDSEPSGKVCKYCGEVHEGFFQKIVGFFHSILALFGFHK